jgi:hypothetical protein
MAEMALGYGSEFQLLRFLGRHRQELEDEIILNAGIGNKKDVIVEWPDFPYWINNGLWFDGEHDSIAFLSEKSTFYEDLRKKWHNYWPQTGKPQCWDAILHCYSNDASKKIDKWFIVEAKAHLQELESSSSAGKESREIISKAFVETQKRFGIISNNSWLERYYQLANRLAFVNFLLENGINVSILNVYFINGWPNDEFKNVTNETQWQDKIKEEYEYLGINENAKKYISEIFLDCLSGFGKKKQ